MKLYEGMFVIDAARAAREWEETLSTVTSVLEKHGASMEKGWRFDERKLAYPITRVRRGVYLLQYFNADPQSITDMREDLNLSEAVLRYMILRVDAEASPETPTLGTATPVPADSAIPGRDAPSTPAPAPKAEEPKAEEAKAEEPKAEEPKAEEPKAEEPKAEEPKAEEPKAEEPVPVEAATEEPPAEETPADEPAEPKKEEA